MATCPTCGQVMKATGPTQATDEQILAELRAQDGGMLYAVGRANGQPDYSQWKMTFGAMRDVKITRGQVLRMVHSGKLVEYCAGNDAAYTTPEKRRALDKAVADRAEARQRRAKKTLPSNQHIGAV